MLQIKARPTAAVLVLAGLLVTAGCIGLNDDEPASQASRSTAQGQQVTKATQQLWEQGYKDPYLDVQPTGDLEKFEFWVKGATINPYGDVELGGLGFAPAKDEPAQVPAPEIRVQQGDTVRVKLHSSFHTVHWHGIDVPYRSDGVPFVTQPMGEKVDNDTYVYEFVAKQPGTYWYHCVVDFPVHADFGMFGPLIVEPKDGPELPYDREQTLMFHEVDSQYFMSRENQPDDDNPTGTLEDPPDKDRLNDNPVDAAESAKRQARNEVDIAGLILEGVTGQETWSEGPRDYYPFGSLRYQPSYDTFMINGKSYPDTEPVEIKEGETLRLRLVNAGQLHKSIHLHGQHMLVTHNDGYPLDEPRWEDTVNLAPGERKDVYVQGTNPGIWKLHDHSGASGMGSTNANDYAFPGGMITALVYEDFQPPEGLPAGEDATAGDLASFAHARQGR